MGQSDPRTVRSSTPACRHPGDTTRGGWEIRARSRLRSSTSRRSFIVTCELALDEAPPDVDRVNLAVDCVLEPSRDASGASRWHLDTSVGAPRLVLDNELRERAQGEGLQRVQVVYGRPTLR